MKYRLTFLFITVIALSTTTSIQAQTRRDITKSNNRSQLITKLEGAAKAHAADSAVAGVAVGVVYKGDTLLLKGYGKADLEFDIPMPGDAVFEIGSVTKQFTAAAILQLAGKDSLDLNADITEYLPEFNSRGHRLTVKNLLHHTSGLRSYTAMARFHDMGRKNQPRDTLLSLMESVPLRFAPGTAMSYSNTGYYLLGLIIERLSGIPYKKYIQKHLFEPAGMSSSYYCDEHAVKDKRAHGYNYYKEQGFRLRQRWNHHFQSYAAGALCSTTKDLLRWNNALHEGEILPDSMYQTMITPGQLDDGTKLRYGTGIGVYKEDGYQIIGHGGAIDGFISESRYYPDNNLAIVVLQNTRARKFPQVLADSLAGIILEPVDNSQIHGFNGDFSKLTGRYTGPSRGQIMDLRIKVNSGKLVASQVGSKEADTLRYRSGLTWKKRTWKYGDNHYRFVRSGNQVVELHLDVVGGYYILRRIRSN